MTTPNTPDADAVHRIAVEAEMAAMLKCLELLRPLDQFARKRVVQWLDGQRQHAPEPVRGNGDPAAG